MRKIDEELQCAKELMQVSPEYMQYVEKFNEYTHDLEESLKEEDAMIRGLTLLTQAAKDQVFLAVDSAGPVRERQFLYHSENKK